jgi:hypothetical protein
MQDWSGVLDGAGEEDASGKSGCVVVARATGQRTQAMGGQRTTSNGKR